MSQLQFLTTGKIKSLIAQGYVVVVHDGYALDLSEWINKHPGGRLSILHMVGRDATDEITVYVQKSSTKSKPARLVPAYICVVVAPSPQFRGSYQELYSLIEQPIIYRVSHQGIKLT